MHVIMIKTLKIDSSQQKWNHINCMKLKSNTNAHITLWVFCSLLCLFQQISILMYWVPPQTTHFNVHHLQCILLTFT